MADKNQIFLILVASCDIKRMRAFVSGYHENFAGSIVHSLLFSPSQFFPSQFLCTNDKFATMRISNTQSTLDW